MILQWGIKNSAPRSFKFYNHWAQHPTFLPMVESLWKIQVPGNPMMRLTSKMKLVKDKLKDWSKTHFSRISEKVTTAKSDLDRIQSEIQVRPLDLNLATQEVEAIATYKELSRQEEASLFQKAKQKDVLFGDGNNTYFHRLVQGRRSANSILSIRNADGVLMTDEHGVSDAFISFYKQLLATEHSGPLLMNCSAPKEWTWLFMNAKGQGLHDLMIQSSVAATIYHLWAERNSRIFRKEKHNQSTIVDRVMKEVKWRLKATCPLKPHAEDIALNTDGSLTDTSASIGGIFRTSEGITLCGFSTGSMSPSILHIEMLAIEKGFHMAIDMDYKEILLQTDSLQAYNIIQGLAQPTWRVRGTLELIRDHLNNMRRFRIKHIFRETNSVADALVALSSSSDKFVFHCNPMPKHISTLVEHDAAGMLYMRL
ncbi:hypothetical protein FRX31_022062 [Thalictrum thalictroides]|uniref:RNase H type-1 domain-containing protein n=1 Tax=Thalictrum thalictroides TaxID=46969 RepID=A0A7J6VTC6_THATH|nr:hypothetical protein FRX31_022062 [Thalictrum thalictroides]